MLKPCTTRLKEVASRMKKIIELLVKCLREGIPLGKGAIEFWVLLTPFLRKRRGTCPACGMILWESGPPTNAFDIMKAHLVSCPKGKEKEESK